MVIPQSTRRRLLAASTTYPEVRTEKITDIKYCIWILLKLVESGATWKATARSSTDSQCTGILY